MITLKDLHMDKYELTKATEALLFGMAEAIDWNKAKDIWYEHYGEVNDDQRQAVDQMFQETKDSIDSGDFLSDVSDYLSALGFPDAFDEILKDDEEPDEEKIE
jgi:hypothetical protein